MNHLIGSASLASYKDSFGKLQAIAYKDITVNGICLGILGIHFMDYGPDWNVKKHKHSFFELHYVTDKHTYTTINNIERRINAGSFYLMPPGTYHSHREDPDSGHIGFALRWEFLRKDGSTGQKGGNFELERICDFLHHASSLPLEDNGEILGGMLNLLDLAGRGCGLLQLQLAFFQMIIAMAGFYTDAAAKTTVEVNRNFLENQIVNSAIKFIEENYYQEIDVDDVANSAHLSYSHLSRLFRKHTGETINYHLNKTRLGRAQRLLMCSDKTVAQIARETGIGDEHYWGEIDRQFILPFGTGEEVRNAVKRAANALLKGKRSGVIAQCEWGVKDPGENIETVFEEWNRY